MSYHRLFASAVLACCSLAMAAPQLQNCHMVNGNVDCDLSGQSSDVALRCDGENACELAVPGYYFVDPYTDHPTLTTVPNSDPVVFFIGAWSPITESHVAQIMLTKSTFANFNAKVRLVNSWLLKTWTNL